MKKRKVCVITGTRAEYGVMKPLLSAIKADNSLQLQLVVTAMHLLKKYGNTVDEIRRNGFQISARVPLHSSTDDPESLARSVGRAVVSFAGVFCMLKPDILLLEADRIEMLAAAVASLPFNIPIVHISGGDVTGGLDDVIRHSITRMSHLHLVNSRGSQERLIKTGEPAKRVIYVGTLAVSKKILGEAASRQHIQQKLGVDFSSPVLLVVQHPVTTEATHSAFQMRQTLEAVKQSGYRCIVIYPNNDMGNAAMIREIEKCRFGKNFKIFRNVPREYFLGLVKNCSLLIGNSSSGIVEAPFFGTPVINVGSRQNGRERADNVVDTGYDRQAILSAIKDFARGGFSRVFSGNPYKDSNTERKIVSVLKKMKIGKDVLEKRLAY